MGLVRMGPPHDLIVLLARHGDLRTFIETGTYSGNTAAWAASVFDSAITVEASRQMYNEATARFGHVRNLRFVFGDSKSVIPQLLPELPGPTLFWLDAHWSGGPTWGDHDECPLLEEIAAIHTSPHPHYILVDDARLFLAPPRAPHKAEQWPTIDRVCDALRAGPHRYHIVVFEDVIVAVPESARQTLVDYCRAKLAAAA